MKQGFDSLTSYASSLKGIMETHSTFAEEIARQFDKEDEDSKSDSRPPEPTLLEMLAVIINSMENSLDKVRETQAFIAENQNLPESVEAVFRNAYMRTYH